MATTEAARASSMGDEPMVRAALADAGEAVSALVPFGVLSKVLPDALLRALRAAGDDLPPPFPRVSAGRELSAATAGLFEACLARRYPPERLEADWPDVHPDVASLLRSFCEHQTGFGPLPWEAPGYEDPRYAIAMLRTAFAGADGPPATGSAPHQRAAEPGPEAPAVAGLDGRSGSLRALLACWLDFLERETWHVRRAFHRGILPLLRRLAAGTTAPSGAAPDLLLFLGLDELTAGAPEPASLTLAGERRDAYLGDGEYLRKHGVGPDRLASLLVPDGGAT
ncbi:MAG TPA: hypothetical protein VEN82_05305 [Actinomycetota bacterium]|nr:hypothetical protein [Actinomycetota bacterium]